MKLTTLGVEKRQVFGIDLYTQAVAQTVNFGSIHEMEFATEIGRHGESRRLDAAGRRCVQRGAAVALDSGGAGDEYQGRIGRARSNQQGAGIEVRGIILLT